MALVNNTTELGFKFIQASTWTSRDPQALTEAELASGDIIFIEATNQIYAGGAYFGVSPEQANLLTSCYNDLNGTQGSQGLKTKVANLEEKVGTGAKLSQALLEIANDLKSKLDGGNYLTGAQGVQGSSITSSLKTSGDQAITNTVDAINRLYELVVAAQSSAGVTGIQGTESITVTGTVNAAGYQTGNITLATDASKIKTTNAGPQGYQNVTIDAALSGHQTILAGHQSAIEGVQSTADNAIAKSSGAQSTLAGDSDVTLTPATLTDADSIITALVTAYNTLVGTGSHNWGENEKKTLGTLRDLINTLRTDVGNLQDSIGNLTDADFNNIVDVIKQIKAELTNPDNANGFQSFLDTVKPVIGGSVASGAQAGKYEVHSGTGGASEYAANLGEIITKLEAEITAAKNAAIASGVTSAQGIQGITITGTGSGNAKTGDITIKADANALTTAALTQTGNHGAQTASGSTIQTALQDINTAAANAHTAADGAQAAANTAEADAQAALGQLKWKVV